MFVFGILGFILILGGIANAIREHGNGNENRVTGYAALAVFGFGMFVSPYFMKSKSAEGAPLEMVAQNVSSGADLITAGQSRVVSMDYERCLGAIAEAGGAVGRAPVNIVETGIVRMVRFPATDGSVLMTCSRLDQRLVITASSSRCGIDINC